MQLWTTSSIDSSYICIMYSQYVPLGSVVLTFDVFCNICICIVIFQCFNGDVNFMCSDITKDLDTTLLILFFEKGTI